MKTLNRIISSASVVLLTGLLSASAQNKAGAKPPPGRDVRVTSPLGSPGVVTSPGLTSPGLTSPDASLTSPNGLSPSLTSPTAGLPAAPGGLTTTPTSLGGTGLTTSPVGLDPALSGGLPAPGEVPISAPIGLDPSAGTYPLLGADPSLAAMPATSSGGGGLFGDLTSAANQLGAGQAIDLLKGMVMPAITSAMKPPVPAAPAPVPPPPAP